MDGRRYSWIIRSSTRGCCTSAGKAAMISLMLHIILVTASSTACPMEVYCQCNFSADGRSIESMECDFNQFKEVPKLMSAYPVNTLIIHGGESLGSEAFTGLNLSHLYIRDTSIEYLPCNSLAGNELLTINIVRCEFAFFPSCALEHMLRLCVAHVEDCKIRELPPGFPRSLREISLRQNRISHFTHSSFSDVHELVSLDLAGNLLSGSISLESHNFHKVRNIDLSDNRITNIAGIPHYLERLNLRGNMLMTFPIGLCHSLLIKVIDLSHNAIGDIPNDCLMFENLRDLYLSDNYLETIPPIRLHITQPHDTDHTGTNKSVDVNVKLHFRENKLTNMPIILVHYEGTVGKIIFDLDISNNSLKILTLINMSFSMHKENNKDMENRGRSTSLQVGMSLNVSHNSISKFPLCSDIHSFNVYHLDLSDNKLAEIPAGMCGMMSLQSINIASNFLTRIPILFFSSQTNLEVANFSNNTVSDIAVRAFDMISNMLLLDLRGNRIIHIDAIMPSLSNMRSKSVLLSDNQIECQCFDHSMSELMILNSVRCERPLSSKGLLYTCYQTEHCLSDGVADEMIIPGISNFTIMQTDCERDTFIGITLQSSVGLLDSKTGDIKIRWNVYGPGVGKNIISGFRTTFTSTQGLEFNRSELVHSSKRMSTMHLAGQVTDYRICVWVLNYTDSIVPVAEDCSEVTAHTNSAVVVPHHSIPDANETSLWIDEFVTGMVLARVTAVIVLVLILVSAVILRSRSRRNKNTQKESMTISAPIDTCSSDIYDEPMHGEGICESKYGPPPSHPTIVPRRPTPFRRPPPPHCPILLRFPVPNFPVPPPSLLQHLLPSDPPPVPSANSHPRQDNKIYKNTSEDGDFFDCVSDEMYEDYSYTQYGEDDGMATQVVPKQINDTPTSETTGSTKKTYCNKDTNTHDYSDKTNSNICIISEQEPIKKESEERGEEANKCHNYSFVQSKKRITGLVSPSFSYHTPVVKSHISNHSVCATIHNQTYTGEQSVLYDHLENSNSTFLHLNSSLEPVDPVQPTADSRASIHNTQPQSVVPLVDRLTHMSGGTSSSSRASSHTSGIASMETQLTESLIGKTALAKQQEQTIPMELYCTSQEPGYSLSQFVPIMRESSDSETDSDMYA